MPVRIGSPRVLARRAVLGSLAASVAVVGLPALAEAAPPAIPFISEFHYDNGGPNNGADVDEFVEVQFAPGTNVTGWTVVLYNGGSTSTTPAGSVYDSDPLQPANADGVAVVAYPSNGIQNGSPDAIALVDPAGALVDFISYEGVVTASNGPAAGKTSTDVIAAETNSTPIGYSISRLYDPAADETFWDGPAPATKGQTNPLAPPVPDVCQTPVTHSIGAVQGEGRSTPVRSSVTVRGTVVGDLPSFGGFFLQDEGDGNAATSDGIFVVSNKPVDLGDKVAATGVPREDFGQTQIPARRHVSVCADGDADHLPTPATLDLPADDDAREPVEGMLVAPADTLTVSEVFALTSFGELTLSEGGLLVQPTELARPGAAADEVAAANALRTVLLDDGLDTRTSNTDRPYLSPSTPVRVGDALSFTEPTVLGFAYGKWRLQPADGTAGGVFEGQNTRTPAPEAVGGDVQIGAFNVLNYFLTLAKDGGRGATTPEAFERQAAKIVPAIEALGADVVTLMEIEDTDSTGYGPGNADLALADLVARLNEAEGSDVWSYVPLPAELYEVDRDVIRNGIIYRHDVVQPDGPSVGLVDESVWFNAREPIAQTFVKDGDAFTVVANHFKSKSPGDDAPTEGDNADSGDGQGTWNGDRLRQAASLASFTDSLRTSTGDGDVVLLGDFNAYTQEDPIVALDGAGYTDLGAEFDKGRYSYVFGGTSGSLDHALATAELAAKVTDVTHWNINAVESFAYQYVGDPALYAADPFRSSDHDPLVLGIELEERCQGLLPTIVGTDGDDALVGTDGIDVIMGLGGADVLTGGRSADVICGGAGNDSLAGDQGDDVLSGGFGDDSLDGGQGADALVGGPGDDALVQGHGAGDQEQDGVREAMAEHNVLSYRLLWFEDDDPADWPATSMAAITTHDLPTVAGLWTGEDLVEQRELGTGTEEELQRGRASLLEHLPGVTDGAPAEEAVERAHQLLAQAPSTLLSATLDDAVGEVRRPNMPGAAQRPNWSLPLPVPVEDLPAHPLLQRVARTLAYGVATGS